MPYVLLWQTDSTRLLYWNKFGMPSGVLTKYEREDCVLSTWWYDEDRADELSRAISENGFLPTVPETVRYDEVATALLSQTLKHH